MELALLNENLDADYLTRARAAAYVMDRQVLHTNLRLSFCPASFIISCKLVCHISFFAQKKPKFSQKASNETPRHLTRARAAAYVMDRQEDVLMDVSKMTPTYCIILASAALGWGS